MTKYSELPIKMKSKDVSKEIQTKLDFTSARFSKNECPDIYVGLETIRRCQKNSNHQTCGPDEWCPRLFKTLALLCGFQMHVQLFYLIRIIFFSARFCRIVNLFCLDRSKSSKNWSLGLNIFIFLNNEIELLHSP